MAIDLILFLILFNYLGVDKNIATIVSTTAGICNNFILNALLNFKVRNKLLVRFVSFYLVGLVGIFVTILIFKLFVDLWHLDTNIIKIASLFVVVLLQYNLNKRISFREVLREE